MNRFHMRSTTVSTLIMASVALVAAGCSDSGGPAVVSTGTSSGSQSGSSSGSGSGGSGSAMSGAGVSGSVTSGSVTSGSSTAGVFTSGSFTSGTTSGTSSGGTGTSSGVSSQMDAAADGPPAAGDGGSGDAGSDASKGDGGGFPDCSNAPIATWKADIYPKIIQPNCGKTCHNGGNSTPNGGGVDLFPTDEGRAWRNLVTQPVKSGYPCTGHYQWRVTCPRTGTIPACAAASTAACACSGPGDPEMSEVYMKLTNKQTCGSAEPQGTPAGVLYPKTMPFTPLPNDQICMWYTWIKAGAMDN